MPETSIKKGGFTLIELLIVIAIIAVLAVVAVLILNPANLLTETRDSTRLSDLADLTNAIEIFSVDTLTANALGNANIVYISVPDPTATSTAGDQCQGLGMPALQGGYLWHCASPAFYRKTNGTGWLPINFSSANLQAPFGSLPVDPVNSTSTGEYYSYATNGTTFEITASPESKKMQAQISQFTQGSNLSILSNALSLNGYVYERSITITSNISLASGTLSNFPLLFADTLTSWEPTSTGGRIQNLCTAPNGGQEPCDLTFSTSSACTNPLNYETESYTPSTGSLADWVNIPTIQAGTVLYACYDNPAVATDQSHASSTWDSYYQAVWHFPNGTTLSTYDSTANGINGTNHGATAIAGEIGGGTNLAASSSQYIGMGNNLNIGTSDFTIETWVKPPNTPQIAAFIIKRLNSNPYSQYVVGIGSVDGGGNGHAGLSAYWFADNGGQPFQSYHTTNNVFDGNWHDVVVTRTSGVIVIYVDGASQALTADSATTTALNTNNTSNFNLGYDNNSGYYNGGMDETRMSIGLARSPSWILTEYNNQSSPTTFFTLGNEVQ